MEKRGKKGKGCVGRDQVHGNADGVSPDAPPLLAERPWPRPPLVLRVWQKGGRCVCVCVCVCVIAAEQHRHPNQIQSTKYTCKHRTPLETVFTKRDAQDKTDRQAGTPQKRGGSEGQTKRGGERLEQRRTFVDHVNPLAARVLRLALLLDERDTLRPCRWRDAQLVHRPKCPDALPKGVGRVHRHHRHRVDFVVDLRVCRCGNGQDRGVAMGEKGGGEAREKRGGRSGVGRRARSLAHPCRTPRGSHRRCHTATDAVTDTREREREREANRQTDNDGGKARPQTQPQTQEREREKGKQTDRQAQRRRVPVIIIEWRDARPAAVCDPGADSSVAQKGKKKKR